MEAQSAVPQTTRSSQNGDGSKQRPWRWERVFLAEKTCKYCGTIIRPAIYRNPDGTLKSCTDEKKWNAKMYCSKTCNCKARIGRPQTESSPGPWKSVRIFTASKTCECCGTIFRPWIKRDNTGGVVSYMKEKEWKRQRFCSISCSKKAENAMWIPSVREKVRQTHQRRGVQPQVRGGNGQLTKPQKQLLEKLGRGWVAEYVVTTDRPRPKRMPNNYKLDLANPSQKIAIELDGISHTTINRREQDKRETAFLLSRGWRVLRISNAKAQFLCSTCKSQDTLRTMLMAFLHTTAI